MNKKVLFFSLLLLSGGLSSLSAQEENNQTLPLDAVESTTSNQTYNTYKTTWQKNGFKDNWTISIGAGVQTIFGEDDSKADFGKRLTFAPQFSIEKYFSPIWGLRFNLTGGTVHGFNDGNAGTYRKWNSGKKNYNGDGYIGQPGYPGWTNSKGQTIPTQNLDFKTWDPQWNYMYSPEEMYDHITTDGKGGYMWNPNVPGQQASKDGGWLDKDGKYLLYMQHIRYVEANVDFMFDFFNLIGNYNPRRFYQLTPYGGVSLFNVFSNLGSNNLVTFGLHGGLLSKFRVSDRVRVNFDLSASIAPDNFDGQEGGERSFTGLAQATLGLGYTFGKTSWTPVEPMDYNLINKLNDEINDLRNRPVPICPDCPKCPPVVESPQKDDIVFLPDPVFFRINKSVIDPTEWSKIEKAIDYLIKHADANVVVTGYADKETGTPSYNMKLSERRAKTVASALTDRFGINPLRVSINWSGEQIQPFKVNEWNRVVIFVIEE